jgi:hypothetical protein
MRNLVVAILACGASYAWAEDAVLIQPPVRLYTAEDLANLHATNPDHYARATRLISAANRLCHPGKPKLQNTDGRDISCGLLLLTSNPPKRELSFVLDRTRYVALVTLTADRPKPLPADEAR